MIELKNINKSFDDPVICSFNAIFSNNEIYKIVGGNGCGKSTLLKIIKGIYIADSGDIIFDKTITQKDIAYIDNNPRSFFHRLSVKNNLLYFLSLQKPNINVSIIDEYLNKFEIGYMKNKLFSDLSQGEMQLVSILRGIVSSPKILILDEALSFLDLNVKKMVVDFIIDFSNFESNVVIFCSHENDLLIDTNYLTYSLE